VSSKSKIVRADPVSAQAEAGNITLIDGPWNADFIHEAEQFPNGSHDDQIDGLSGAYAALLAKADVQSTSYRQPAQDPVIKQGDLTLTGRHHIDRK
jgi:phage terminase large subunit-like protein